MWLWSLFACAEPESGWMLTLYGAVVDAEGGLLPGVEVSVVSLETGALMGTVESGDDGSWFLPVFLRDGEEDQLFSVAVSAAAEGYERGLTYAEAILRTTRPDYPFWAGPGQSLQSYLFRVPSVTLVSSGEDSSGEGTLIDATTGEPVPLALIELREGYNAPDSRSRAASINTDSEGRFSVTELPGGLYTARVEPFTGYDRTRFPVLVVPGGAPDQRGLISPPTGSESLRVGLSWDVRVADLDLHLTGPLAGSSEDTARFHVWQGDPVHPPTDEPVALMELLSEDLESAAVTALRDRSVYRFSAYDTTNAELVDSDALSRSRALVQLWWGGEAWMEEVTPGVQATLWRALEWDPLTQEVVRLQEYESDVEPDATLHF